MSKVICDICGTAYPSAAKKCPICGSGREYAMEAEDDASMAYDFLDEEIAPAPKKRNREIFDFDEVNQETRGHAQMDDDDYDQEEEEDDGSGTNIALVIVLVVLIMLLLLTAGFFFLRYLLPGMMPQETLPPPTEAPSQAATFETEDAGKPCTNLMMDGGKMELGKDGRKLLNIRVYPEDTTDTVTYVSGDESIVTVSEDGIVTAVGEGQTVITISCGEQYITCNVTVDYTIGEETVPTGEVPPVQAAGVDATESSGETEAAAAAEETAATEAPQSSEATEETKKEPKLKLKTEDITIGTYRASAQLQLDCDIKPEDIDWFTMDSTVAIVHDGLVTATGSGVTRIYGEYGGEQIMCIVRCIF